jgi:hypothetical protein
MKRTRVRSSLVPRASFDPDGDVRRLVRTGLDFEINVSIP